MDTAVRSDTGEASPSALFGDLFAAVAMSGILPAKDWADAAPKASPQNILELYRSQAPTTSPALMQFVRQWFDLPIQAAATRRGESVDAHIEATWPALIRPAGAKRADDSLLPLPHPLVAPGGRFRECYYWDCYFTLVGLRDRPEIIRASADNFRWQIERYGFVPTANRTYYLSRSQPPLLFKIVELLAEVEGGDVVAEYLPALVQEYRFWMDGAERLLGEDAHRRVVRLKDGALLNRYWDDLAAPRDESYQVDVATAKSASQRPSQAVYRDIRAACESGWDFSSRWLERADDFSSIITTSIVPADLNSMLFGLERFIAAALAAHGDASGADFYAAAAGRRRQAMCTHLWNDRLGAFDDLDWARGRLRGAASAAATAPLFFGLANDEQAGATAAFVRAHLLAPGGLLTTTTRTDLQWDAPNGWAPLQWIAAEGFARCGFDELAGEIRQRWRRTVERVFQHTGRLVEKYDVVEMKPGGGGEYALQDGFGWTNGVTKAFGESMHSSR